MEHRYGLVLRTVETQWRTTPLERVNKVDVDIFLPKGHNWNNFVSLAVYCVQKKVVLADVAIDKTLAESVPLHNPKAYIKKANITGKGAYAVGRMRARECKL